MSINATFGGQTYTEVETLVATDGTNTATVTLSESGVIPTPTDTKNITANGENINVLNYAKVNVNVPGGGVTPTGTISITANGTGIDVANYAYADVAVPGGGITPTGTKEISITENGTVTEDITNYASVEIDVDVDSSGYSLSDIIVGTLGTKVVVPDYNDFTTQGYTIRTYTFAGCIDVEEFFIESAGPLGATSGYRGCTSLETVVAPYATNASGTDMFNGCTSLETVDVGPINSFGQREFQGCTSLNKLILRGDAAITALSNVNVFGSTPFDNGGTGGTIYIPETLYNHLGDGQSLDYKAASNWSTLDGYGTITWAKIEGSAYETAYADGTPISS